MEVLLIFVTLFAASAARNVPDTVYVPTKEQLERIFGDDTAQPQAVETPAAVPNESVFTVKSARPTLKRTSNVLCKSVTPATVELNIKIKVSDCEQQGASIDDSVQENNKNMNPTSVGAAQVKPASGNPEVHTRFVDDGVTDDRMSLTSGKDCATGLVRFGDSCVVRD